MPPTPAPEFSEPRTPTTPPSSPAVVSAPLPRFLPRSPSPDPAPEGTTVSDPQSSPVLADVAPEDTRRSSASPRTSSSAGEKADPKIVAGALAAVVGIVATLVSAVLLRGPRPRELRRPTDEQADAIAAPLARIAGRHVPAAVLAPDLMDGIAAAAAVGNYIAEGPITSPAYDAGQLPDDPDTEES